MSPVEVPKLTSAQTVNGNQIGPHDPAGAGGLYSITSCMSDTFIAG